MKTTKRFLLDNDGGNFFGSMKEDIEASIEEAIMECPDNVTTYMLCSGAGTCYWPTKIGYVTAKDLVAAHTRGLDPLGMLLRRLKAAGKETFITYRMNDVHNPTDANQWNTPRIRRENPDCIVGLEEVRQGRGDWMSYCMDYTMDDMRQYVLSLIREQISLYGGIIDGFQLDWMRFPRHLSGTPDEVWEKRNAITQFTADVRKLLKASGKNVFLSARVPTNPAGCRYTGMDLAEWTRQGLVDFIVASSFLRTDFWMPIMELRKLMGSNPVPIYANVEMVHSNLQFHCPESLRAAVLGLFGCGADGIYVFNFPCWTEDIAERPYYWLKGLDSPDTAAAKPLLFSIPCKKNRILNVDLPWQLPAALKTGRTLEFTIHLPNAVFSAWRAIFLVHSCGEVVLSVKNLEIKVRVPAEVKKAFVISPEFNGRKYKQGKVTSEKGITFINLTIPKLEFYDLVVIELSEDSL